MKLKIFDLIVWILIFMGLFIVTSLSVVAILSK